MNDNALGLIEVIGYISAVEAADAALKAANVYLIGVEKVGDGIVTIGLMGDVGAIKASVDAGAAAAERVGTLRTKHIIPRTHPDVRVILFNKKEQNKIKETPKKEVRLEQKIKSKPKTLPKQQQKQGAEDKEEPKQIIEFKEITQPTGKINKMDNISNHKKERQDGYSNETESLAPESLAAIVTNLESEDESNGVKG